MADGGQRYQEHANPIATPALQADHYTIATGHAKSQFPCQGKGKWLPHCLARTL